jgi:hypothetical protein
MAEQFIEQQVAEFARKYPTVAAIPAAKDAPAPKAPAPEARAQPNVIQLKCTNFAKQRKRHPDDNIASSDSESDSSSEYSDSNSESTSEEFD